MTALTKQVQLDPVTNLYHERAFRKIVSGVLKEFTQKWGDQQPEKLSLADRTSSPTLMLGFLSLQPKETPEDPFSLSQESEWRVCDKRNQKEFPKGDDLVHNSSQPSDHRFCYPIPKKKYRLRSYPFKVLRKWRINLFII